jgi:hypothetical protein
MPTLPRTALSQLAMSTRKDRAKAVARAVGARVEREPLLTEQRDAERDVEAAGRDGSHSTPGASGGQRGRTGSGVAAARTAAAAAHTAESREANNDSNMDKLYMVGGSPGFA